MVDEFNQWIMLIASYLAIIDFIFDKVIGRLKSTKKKFQEEAQTSQKVSR